MYRNSNHVDSDIDLWTELPVVGATAIRYRLRILTPSRGGEPQQTSISSTFSILILSRKSTDKHTPSSPIQRTEIL